MNLLLFASFSNHSVNVIIYSPKLLQINSGAALLGKLHFSLIIEQLVNEEIFY